MKHKVKEVLLSLKSKAIAKGENFRNKALVIGTMAVSSMMMAIPASAEEAGSSSSAFEGIITADTFSPVVSIFKAVILAVIGIIVGFIAFKKAWAWAKSQIFKA